MHVRLTDGPHFSIQIRLHRVKIKLVVNLQRKLQIKRLFLWGSRYKQPSGYDSYLPDTGTGIS